MDGLAEVIGRLAQLFVGAPDVPEQPAAGGDAMEFEVVPPGQQIQVRDDQVQNNAGGFVFQVSDETRVRRFLILGCESGTYYVNKDELKTENAAALVQLIESGKGDMVLREIHDVTSANRAPKRDQAIYALALCARLNFSLDGADEKQKAEYRAELQKAAFRLLPVVVRIPTDLFAFLGHCEKISLEHGKATGWGRMMRKVVEQWYLSKPPKHLALQMTKYKNRQGYTHRDALRLCHADPHHASDEDRVFYDALFYYATQGKLDEKLQKKLEDYGDEKAAVEAAKLKPENAERCAELIREFGLVREHVPTELLNDATVWKALLENMPLIAMIRNLGKLSALGLIDGRDPQNEQYVDKVCGDLLNEQKLKKTGVHPMAILLALGVYKAGKSLLGKQTFTSNPRFANVKPTGKRFCVALDVSGSMSCQIAGTLLSCREGAIGLALVTHRVEENVEVVAFCGHLTEIHLDKDTTFAQFHDKIYNLSFGTTDCSLPMIWAKQNKKEFDVFIVNPTDPGMLDVVGFDSSSPQLISEFVLGRV
ncbi:hypothetical protein M3Y99_00844800 [Aphelenchoides fujianensis]|nr:hypothetical protein M3Y99_00844800 [Aphelenchoides fujianensis]